MLNGGSGPGQIAGTVFRLKIEPQGTDPSWKISEKRKIYSVWVPILRIYEKRKIYVFRKIYVKITPRMLIP